MLRNRVHLAWAGLALVLTTNAGCNWIAYIGYVIASTDDAAIMPADYRGLEHQTVGVLVAADEYVLYEYPHAPQAICGEISGYLVNFIPNVQVISPEEIHHFQSRHPYWNTLPYDDLLTELGVSRLIIVDLTRYTTHQPGNPHLRQGTLAANITVAEVDMADPNQAAYARTIEARFPPGSSIGRIGTDDAIVRSGLHKAFAQKVTNLFRDYKVVAE